ncbi:MAG: hypothetical protein M5R38_18455 [Candidatus Methylomirabilis sp.]|nr:hypothetical protein [Candidatus Methylomirabilis sp.]
MSLISQSPVAISVGTGANPWGAGPIDKPQLVPIRIDLHGVTGVAGDGRLAGLLEYRRQFLGCPLGLHRLEKGRKEGDGRHADDPDDCHYRDQLCEGKPR